MLGGELSPVHLEKQTKAWERKEKQRNGGGQGLTLSWYDPDYYNQSLGKKG